MCKSQGTCSPSHPGSLTPGLDPALTPAHMCPPIRAGARSVLTSLFCQTCGVLGQMVTIFCTGAAVILDIIIVTPDANSRLMQPQTAEVKVRNQTFQTPGGTTASLSLPLCSAQP